MALGLADVSDCFHRMRIPTTLGAWFCRPPVTAGEMSVVGMNLGKRPLGPYELIFPCPDTLPMGFSWSVYLCQCAGKALFKHGTRFEKCPVVSDRDKPIFHESEPKECEDCCGYMYVDNRVGRVAGESREGHMKTDVDFLTMQGSTITVFRSVIPKSLLLERF